MDTEKYLDGLVKALENHELPKDYLKGLVDSSLADWKKLAEEGNAAGQYLYEHVQKDLESALVYYRKAADEGLGDSIYNR